MTTTNTIGAEGRKRVAEAVTGRECTWEDGLVYIIGGFLGCRFFRPDTDSDHWQALVQKAGQLIEELKGELKKDLKLGDPEYQLKLLQIQCYQGAFQTQIAKNDVNAIEALVLQLLEGKE